jgi:flagellin-like protein
MANFKKNDEAVSAVIGVILMVAITVILAAVIAAFVFQLGGNVPKSKQVGVEVKRTTTDGIILVKTMSGADVGLLKTGDSQTNCTYNVQMSGRSVAIIAPPGTGTPIYTANAVGLAMYFGSATVGSADYIGANADLTVVAHFTDGTDFPAWSGNLA